MRRALRIDPAAAGLGSIRERTGVPSSFPADVVAEAEAAARGAPRGEPVEVPFVTIDPPGARDLDQAIHLERRGDGYRVRYAIADVGSFVAAGGALDRETHRRGVTVYLPDGNIPLHPRELSEGAASLLPDQAVPAVLWTIDLDARGEAVATDVRRARVRSVGQHTYADVPGSLAPLLREIGELRIARERDRGGIRLGLPEQEVVPDGAGWRTRYRVPLDSEDHNAQISLLTGMEAAKLMLGLGTGILRTQPAPSEKALGRLRHQARALGVDWARETSYPELVRSLDPAVPAQAALMHQAARLGTAAGYTAFVGTAPEPATHFAVAAPYAHATAPLRRLQDRFVSECCLAACAGTPVPDWVHRGLAALPDAMAAGDRRAGAAERAALDLVEALLLAGREGETFPAVVVDEGLVQLAEPAVRARLDEKTGEPGTEVRVRLTLADPHARKVLFTLA